MKTLVDNHPAEPAPRSWIGTQWRCWKCCSIYEIESAADFCPTANPSTVMVACYGTCNSATYLTDVASMGRRFTEAEIEEQRKLGRCAF